MQWGLLSLILRSHNNGRKKGSIKMMQRGIGVGEWPTRPPAQLQWTYRALLLNGCKEGLSLAHLARFQVVLNGGIDRHSSYRALWLGNAPFRDVFSSAKKYPWCCGGEALNHATTFGMCQCCCEEWGESIHWGVQGLHIHLGLQHL